MVRSHPLFLPTWSKPQWFRLGFQIISKMSQVVHNFIFISHISKISFAKGYGKSRF